MLEEKNKNNKKLCELKLTIDDDSIHINIIILRMPELVRLILIDLLLL